MNYYFDTSAILKNYIDEAGSEVVSALLNESDIVFVSEITLVESFSALTSTVLLQCVKN
jgi:PIN domain nuclease of toxin-antitoxin system